MTGTRATSRPRSAPAAGWWSWTSAPRPGAGPRGRGARARGEIRGRPFAGGRRATPRERRQAELGAPLVDGRRLLDADHHLERLAVGAPVVLRAVALGSALEHADAVVEHRDLDRVGVVARGGRRQDRQHRALERWLADRVLDDAPRRPRGVGAHPRAPGPAVRGDQVAQPRRVRAVHRRHRGVVTVVQHALDHETRPGLVVPLDQRDQLGGQRGVHGYARRTLARALPRASSSTSLSR